MIAVIFEARPRTERRQAYLDTACKILSLSLWRGGQAVERWRNVEAHRRAQDAGRRSIFADYRLRVARVLRDYGMHERDQAPAQ